MVFQVSNSFLELGDLSPVSGKLFHRRVNSLGCNRRQGRDPQVDIATFQVAHYASLAADNGSIPDLEMPPDSRLPGKGYIIAEPGASCDSHLGDKQDHEKEAGRGWIEDHPVRT